MVWALQLLRKMRIRRKTVGIATPAAFHIHIKG